MKIIVAYKRLVELENIAASMKKIKSIGVKI